MMRRIEVPDAPDKASAARPVCGRCYGAGVVQDILGDPGPCSRCQPEAFMLWAHARRPKKDA